MKLTQSVRFAVDSLRRIATHAKLTRNDVLRVEALAALRALEPHLATTVDAEEGLARMQAAHPNLADAFMRLARITPWATAPTPIRRCKVSGCIHLPVKGNSYCEFHTNPAAEVAAFLES